MTFYKDFLLKPLLMLAIAAPVFTAANVSDAQAGDRKRAAIIAGAIIGGVIAHRAYRKNRHRHYRRSHGYSNRYYAPRRAHRRSRGYANRYYAPRNAHPYYNTRSNSPKRYWHPR